MVLSLPVEPPWVHWVTVAGAFFNMALAMAALLLLSSSVGWRGSFGSAGGMEMFFVCATLGVEAAVLGLIGASELISARGCGGQPRQIGFDASDLISIFSGWRGMVRKRWSLAEIRWIRTSTRRSFNSGDVRVRIVIGISGKWFGLRACGSDKDGELAATFTKLLEQAVREQQQECGNAPLAALADVPGQNS